MDHKNIILLLIIISAKLISTNQQDGYNKLLYSGHQKPATQPMTSAGQSPLRSSIIMPPNNKQAIDNGHYNHFQGQQDSHIYPIDAKQVDQESIDTGTSSSSIDHLDPSLNSSALNNSHNHPNVANIERRQELGSRLAQASLFNGGNLELILRQAAGDESVFQSSPGIGVPPGHSVGWSQPSLPVSKDQSPPEVPKIQQLDSSQSTQVDMSQQHAFVSPIGAPSLTTSASGSIELPSKSPQVPLLASSSTFDRSTITDRSNSIHASGEHYSDYLGQQQQHSNHKEYRTYTKEADAHRRPLEQANNPIVQELSNQVVYEGPATAPPTGDFYFASSHSDQELSIGERPASNLWWFLTVIFKAKFHDETRDPNVSMGSKLEREV